MRRKLIILCVTVLLILTCSFPAFAEDFDPGVPGAISVTLTEPQENTPIVGAELCVYYVATVSMDSDGRLIYDHTEDFKPVATGLDDPLLAEKLDAFVSQHSVPSVKITTNAAGTAMCDELPLGLYFVKQTGAAEGVAPCMPFLVTVPGKTADGYVYEVNASPKTELVRLTSITVKKVWNTDGAAKAAESVTVQLLHNGNAVKTAVLNEENNWQVTYSGMPESDAYSIQEIHIPKGFTATYSQTGYVFAVTNTPSLAQTGQLIWPIPVLAVGGMLLIAVGSILLQKKRKTMNDDKKIILHSVTNEEQNSFVGLRIRNGEIHFHYPESYHIAKQEDKKAFRYDVVNIIRTISLAKSKANISFNNDNGVARIAKALQDLQELGNVCGVQTCGGFI